jgi:hypothetical protein
MLGANAVHMTLLHELIAHATGIPIGKYRVVTNNLHVYVNIWNKEMTPPDIDDPYPCNILPLLQNGESYEDLMADCTDLLELLKVNPRTVWMEQVALPMYDAYLDKSNRMDHMIRIKAEDWRTAAMEWNDRREQKRLATEARLG